MRHNKRGRKFGRNTAHRSALLKNLARAILTHGQIQTTLPKAKEIRPIVEKLVTKGRDNSLHVRRQLASYFNNDFAMADKIITDWSVKYKSRPGGYLRIVKMGYRQGDAAPMALIQFVEEKVA